MHRLLLGLLLLTSAPSELPAAEPPSPPARVGTIADFRQLLLASKWSWRNVRAGVPDRECVFMDDGTFRHPNFTAKFTLKDINIVELRRKGGKATLTFDPTYTKFEAIDFDQRRITGARMR